MSLSFGGRFEVTHIYFFEIQFLSFIPVFISLSEAEFLAAITSPEVFLSRRLHNAGINEFSL